jgi:subtilase family protein
MPQQRRRRTRRPRAAESPFPAPRELVVIADPQAGFRVRPGSVEATAVAAAPIEKALSATDAQMKPLFGATEERVRYDVAEQAALTGERPPDLSVYYTCDAEDSRLDELAEQLLATDGIVGAYVAPPAEPPLELELLNEMVPSEESAPPATPDFTSRQTYLGAAPGGIDAQYAWTLPGGRGAGVRICDVEGAWRFDHEDLLANQGGAVGTQSTDLTWRNHGTAVASEFGGDVNAFGVTGICADANVRGFSIFAGTGSAGAIRAAADALGPGDIVLIELHRPGPGASGVGQDGFIAVEWWPADFDAIRYAVTKGVIVVEAAGNGSRNLDDAIYNTPQPGFPPGWTNPFNRSNRDSGAIVVGAGAPPPGTHGRDHGPDRSRLDFSNYGSMLDAQGWGREVTACAYGDLQGGADERVWYTDQFSGTSSASPIVVGTCGCIQGVRRAQGQPPHTPVQMRSVLRSTGSPQQDAPGRPASQRIGNRPNLRQVLGPKPKEIHKEKLEKPERKEVKEFKLEKNEKPERKEVKEFKLEKAERKEGKEGKLEKNEKLEIEGGGFGPGSGGLEERVGALEQAMGQLNHFITREMRPDLSLGALSGETDYPQLSSDPGGKPKEEVEKLAE